MIRFLLPPFFGLLVTLGLGGMTIDIMQLGEKRDSIARAPAPV